MPANMLDRQVTEDEIARLSGIIKSAASGDPRHCGFAGRNFVMNQVGADKAYSSLTIYK
jgi:hypothetical protein